MYSCPIASKCSAVQPASASVGATRSMNASPPKYQRISLYWRFGRQNSMTALPLGAVILTNSVNSSPPPLPLPLDACTAGAGGGVLVGEAGGPVVGAGFCSGCNRAAACFPFSAASVQPRRVRICAPSHSASAVSATVSAVAPSRAVTAMRVPSGANTSQNATACSRAVGGGS